MGWTRIAHATAGATSDPKSIAAPSIDSTGADLIVIAVGWFPNAGVNASVSSNKAGTVSLCTVRTISGQIAVRLFFMDAPTVGSGHIFTAFNATTNIFPSISVEAWSGAHSSPLDQQAGGTSAGATHLATGSYTPSEAGTLSFAALANENNSGGARSIDSGFTLGDGTAYSGGNHEGVHIAYFEQGSAAALNPDWNITNSAALAVAAASFKAAVVAAGQPTMRRWGGVPHMGGRSTGSKHGPSGRSFGRTRSGLYVPNHLREAA